MLAKLRRQLTLLFLGAGILLVLLVSASAYAIVSYQFQRTTDRALQHVMAEHLRLLGEPLPPELAEAELAWYEGPTGLLPPQISAALLPYLPEAELPEDLEIHETTEEQALDAELAAIFVLALSDSGRLLPGFNTEVSPLQPDREAVEEAAEHQFDWRIIRPNRTRVRLFTYQLQNLEEPSYLQVGRSLADQDALRRILGIGLLTLGGVSLVLLGSASWWLAGRSIQPTEQALERQQAFIANASHELKTPLTLIQTSAEVALRKQGTNADQSDYLKEIIRETRHMNKLVEDQLLLSRLDQGEFDLTLQPVPLDQMVSDLTLQLSRLPTAQGVQIEQGVESRWVLGDPTRVRQILLILLDNALRYSPPGSHIKVTARPRGNQVEITVADDGPGIPPEDMSRVMERFYRVDKARSRAGGGSGLGLSIAKMLVEAHQGTLEISSQMGQGTNVIISLPAFDRD